MNILFFHRLDLVHLYAPIAKELTTNHVVIHIAFSNVEENILRKEYGIVENVFNFIKIRDSFFDCKDSDLTIEELDQFIIKYTNGRFNLNSSIHLDRTYKNLSIDECYQISIAYYKTWEFIFKKTKPSLFFHEPPAIFATHLASIFCRFIGARYLTQIHVVGLNKYQWIFLEGDDAFPIEIEIFKNTESINLDYSYVNCFIQNFKNNDGVLMAELSTNIAPSKGLKIFSLLRKMLGLIYRILIFRFKTKVNPKDHINRFLENNKKSFFVELENIFGRTLDYYYSQPNEDERFFFYPMHLEPEAVVLYYADGWYQGQVKLIENIAMQLPAGVLLYVKDHPHGGVYRDVRDYKQLLQHKNVKLINPEISGKELIKNSLGVITINGTAGFEALLMNKYVFCFGKSFYSGFKGVTYLNHIKDLKQAILNTNLDSINHLDLNEIYSFLKASHEGFVSFFAGRQSKIGIDLRQNAKTVVIGIKKLINKLEN